MNTEKTGVTDHGFSERGLEIVRSIAFVVAGVGFVIAALLSY